MITTVLTDDEIHVSAPSVFADRGHARTSARYALIPTIRVVDALRSEGWLPTLARETRVRDADRRGYAKHLLRFRRREASQRTAVVGDVIPEIILLNAHDGSSSYELHAGFFRVVCGNGLVVADATVQRQRVRHAGDVVERVIEGVYEIVRELPEAAQRIRRYRDIVLDTGEATRLAAAALRLRYPVMGSAPITAPQLLWPRRAEDLASDLWTRLNVIQENLLRGGLNGRSAQGRRVRTRGIRAVNTDVRLNKALWCLADDYARVSAAA